MMIRIYHFGQIVKVETFQTLAALRERYIQLQSYETIYTQVVLKGKELTTAQAYKALAVKFPCEAYHVNPKLYALYVNALMHIKI